MHFVIGHLNKPITSIEYLPIYEPHTTPFSYDLRR